MNANDGLDLVRAVDLPPTDAPQREAARMAVIHRRGSGTAGWHVPQRVMWTLGERRRCMCGRLLPCPNDGRPITSTELVPIADRPRPPDAFLTRSFTGWSITIDAPLDPEVLAILFGPYWPLPMSLERGECGRCGMPTERLRGTALWWHRFVTCSYYLAGAYRRAALWNRSADRAHVPLEADWRPTLPCPTPWTCSPHYCHGGCGGSSV